jgi:hypothetical protein
MNSLNMRRIIAQHTVPDVSTGTSSPVAKTHAGIHAADSETLQMKLITRRRPFFFLADFEARFANIRCVPDSEISPIIYTDLGFDSFSLGVSFHPQLYA